MKKQKKEMHFKLEKLVRYGVTFTHKQPVHHLDTAIPCTDIDGREHKSLSDMARAYGIEPHILSDREKLGWPIEQILYWPVRKKKEKS